MGKFIKLKNIKKIKFERPIVLTGGVFDLFHIGHAEFLKLCKTYGETLVVLVASDRNVKDRKGEDRPILNENERARLLSYLNFVDYVFVSDRRCEDRYIHETINPDILVLSDENKSDKSEFIRTTYGNKECKVDVRFVPAKFYSVGMSTSQIVNKIKGININR